MEQAVTAVSFTTHDLNGCAAGQGYDSVYLPNPILGTSNTAVGVDKKERYITLKARAHAHALNFLSPMRSPLHARRGGDAIGFLERGRKEEEETLKQLKHK